MPLKRKIAYIDLTTGEIEMKAIPIELRKKWVGGRGLDAYLLYNHCKPKCNPFGPDNSLLISGGIIAGCPASASARTHVMAKSPLTGYVGSANMGGFFAPELAWAGFHHLVIKGKAEKPVYIFINDDEVEIRDAKNVWGAGIYDTQDIIRKELRDEEVQVLCCGPAGENLVRFANVMTGHKNSGGRTGMGAVMGSKNLKAVAVRGTMDLDIAFPQEALEYNKELIDMVIKSKVSQVMQRWGTMFMYGVTNSTGLIRTRNFQKNQLFGGEDLECENLDNVSIGFDGCFGCQVHCRQRYIINEGPYAGVYTQGPEYASQGAFGTEPEINDMESVLVANHLVNDYGMDTLEIGSMIAWAMELYETGILTVKDTDGVNLEFGNKEALLTMIEKIAKREGLGDILAEGPLRAAQKIGKGSEKYLIHVKGMSNLHSDERATPALALNIATASRGSDHLRSRPAIDLYNLPIEVLDKVYRNNPVPYEGPLVNSYNSYVGKPWMVMWQEMNYMAVDSMGMCKFHTIFLGVNHPTFPEFSKILYLNTGLEMSPEEIWNAANRASTMERLFNIREGMTRKDDMLVDRYFDEPTPGGFPVARGKHIDRKKFKAMLDEYYQLHEWDKNGVPTGEFLKKMGIDEEPSHQL